TNGTRTRADRKVSTAPSSHSSPRPASRRDRPDRSGPEHLRVVGNVERPLHAPDTDPVPDQRVVDLRVLDRRVAPDDRVADPHAAQLAAGADCDVRAEHDVIQFDALGNADRSLDLRVVAAVGLAGATGLEE